MLEQLTTSFTSALSNTELRRYLADAIETQNMVTFYEISREFVKRGQPCDIIYVMRSVLKSGHKFSYYTAFANTVKNVCYELRYDAPLFSEIWDRFDRHDSDEEEFTIEVMDKLYNRESYHYFSTATAEDLANMSANIWMMLFDRYSELSRNERESNNTLGAELEENAKNVHSMLRDRFRTQIDDIVKRDDLIHKMKRPIRKALMIDERKAEYDEYRPCSPEEPNDDSE